MLKEVLYIHDLDFNSKGWDFNSLKGGFIMKKKIAVLLVAAMTMAMAAPAFAHQVIVVDPSKVVEEAVEEAVVEETAEEAAVEETAEEAVVEETAEEAVVEETTEEAVVEETTEEAVVEETAVEPIVTSPNKEKDREVVAEDGTTLTYSKVKEPKTIFNTAPSAEHPFTDVSGEAEKYAEAAYSLGMTIGMVRGTQFVPDGTLTMEDAITWLYRLFDGEGKNGIILTNISEANGYAQKPLTWAVGLGLVGSTVEPKKEITVNEFNAILAKLGYNTGLIGTDATMTRIDGLKQVLNCGVASSLTPVSTADYLRDAIEAI